MKKLIIALSLLVACQSADVFAARAKVVAKVIQVFIADGVLGNCGAYLSELIVDSATSPLNCPSRVVSFSCTGDFLPKDIAYHLYDNAQMSLVLDKTVRVYIDDTKKHNSYCLAYRLDVFK
jgi:hypothetical protein